jgi:hypothetical protein
VPEPGALPQRPQTGTGSFAASESPQSAWAPPPPAQSAADDNPFPRRTQAGGDDNPFGRQAQPTGDDNPFARQAQPAPEDNPFPRRTQPAGDDTPFGRPAQPVTDEDPFGRPAQPAEDNPFARQADPHPYRSSAGDLPQRSPGIAGGPLDGPVGEFNGFTPTRQPADSAPSSGPDMPRRAGASPFDRQDPAPADGPAFGAPADQPPFGGAERSPFAPVPREPSASASGEQFGARADEGAQFGSRAGEGAQFGSRAGEGAQAGDRPPGISVFGNQRVRVPGAALTGLSDAPPVDPANGGLPAREGSESGGFATRSGESGGFPTRGGSGNGSFPIRGGGARSGTGTSDADGGAFSAREAASNPSGPGDSPAGDANGTAYPSRSDADGAYSARGDSNGSGFPADADSNPFRDGTFRRDEAGGTFRRDEAGGGFPAPGTSDGGGFPVRAASDGDRDQSGPDRPDSGQSDARQGFDSEQSSPFGRSEQSSSGNGYAQRIPGASFASTGMPDTGGGYSQRVPGASFGNSDSPAVAEARGGAAVPHPRDPSQRPESGQGPQSGEPPAAAERPGPAKGTARPVSASASVPVASRVTPPGEAEEVPPPSAASRQPRVYGRPAPADEPAPQSPYQDEERPAGGFGAAPTSGARSAAPTSGTYGQAPESQDDPYAAPVAGSYGQAPENQDNPYARPPADGTYGKPPESQGNPYARPVDGAYGKPPQTDGTYGRPAEAPFGASDPGDDRADPYALPDLGGREAPRPFDGTAPTSGAPEAAPTSGPFGAAPTSGPFGAAPTSGPFGAAPTSGGFGTAPTSGGSQPGRPSGRATASARVSPPPAGQPFAPASPAPGQTPEARNAAQFSEFTTDIAGRGRSEQQLGPVPGNPAARTTPPDQFSENTTDVSGRGQGPEQPYVPAAALPSMHAAPPLENGFPPAQAPESSQPFGDRPRMGGVFPGPASRATVTPPGPEQTAAWPSRPEPDADQGRFDSFKQDAPEIVPTEVAKPETPHVRMLPVILGVILGAGLIVGLTLGVTWLIARGSNDGGTTFSVSAGDCVKRNGEAAVTANCSDAGSFEVTAIVDAKEQCPDPNQPYVINPTDNGRTQVLCLKPRG